MRANYTNKQALLVMLHEMRYFEAYRFDEVLQDLYTGCGLRLYTDKHEMSASYGHGTKMTSSIKDELIDGN